MPFYLPSFFHLSFHAHSLNTLCDKHYCNEQKWTWHGPSLYDPCNLAVVCLGNWRTCSSIKWLMRRGRRWGWKRTQGRDYKGSRAYWGVCMSFIYLEHLLRSNYTPRCWGIQIFKVRLQGTTYFNPLGKMFKKVKFLEHC